MDWWQNRQRARKRNSQLILGPLHAILVIALLITPLIFSHKELLSLTGTEMYLAGVGWEAGEHLWSWAPLQKQCLFRPWWGRESWRVAHNPASRLWLHLWYEGAVCLCTLPLPSVSSAIAFSCSSLLFWISLTYTLGLCLDITSSWKPSPISSYLVWVLFYVSVARLTAQHSSQGVCQPVVWVTH